MLHSDKNVFTGYMDCCKTMLTQRKHSAAKTTIYFIYVELMHIIE